MRWLVLNFHHSCGIPFFHASINSECSQIHLMEYQTTASSMNTSLAKASCHTKMAHHISP